MKYFLHDSSAMEDEKVSKLFVKFGYEGVGLFYAALEKLAKQEKPIDTDVLKYQLKVGKKLNKCWEFMESLGVILSNNGETFNKQLLKFSEKYQIKKEKNAERISEWRKNQEVIENVTHYKTVSNTPKDNISKVNVSKEINNTGGKPPKSFKLFSEDDFYNEVFYFKNFDEDLLKGFFNYWKEKSPTGKMKFQLQKTWETNLRLQTWQRNQYERNQKNNTGNANNSAVGRDFKAD